jgi:hypothetical protein
MEEPASWDRYVTGRRATFRREEISRLYQCALEAGLSVSLVGPPAIQISTSGQRQVRNTR